MPQRRLGGWQQELRLPLAVAIGARMLTSVAAAYLNGMYRGIPVSASTMLHLPTLPGAWEGLVGVWDRWDGAWYVLIAQRGYSMPYSAAFYPLYPGLIWLVGHLAGSGLLGNAIAGVVISTVAFALALVYLARLIRLDYDERTALWTLLLLAAFPVAFVFQAVYTESLFLFLSVACLYYARVDRWWLAGAFGFFATLCRVPGLLLVLPLVWMWWKQRQGQSAPAEVGQAQGEKAAPSSRQEWQKAAAVTLVPLGLVALAGVDQWQAGSPTAFLTAQTWFRQTGLPLASLFQGIGTALNPVLPGTVAPASRAFVLANFEFHLWMDVTLAVAAVALAVLAWKYLRPEVALYAGALVVFHLSIVANGSMFREPLAALPRYLLVMWPLFLVAARLDPHGRVLRWVLPVFVLLQVWLLSQFVTLTWVV